MIPPQKDICNLFVHCLSAALCTLLCAGCIFGPDGDVPETVETAITESLIDSTENGTTDEPSNGSTDESATAGMGSAPPPNVPDGVNQGSEDGEDCEFTNTTQCGGAADSMDGIGHGTPQPHDPSPEPGTSGDEEDA